MEQIQIKKLGKRELLELLLQQTKRTETLEKEAADTTFNYENRIETMKKEHEKAMKAMKAEYEATLKRTKADLEKELDTITAEYTKELEEANAKLNQQTIRLENAGSIAEASLQITNVFEEAQKSAEIYLKSIKEKSDKIDEEIRIKAETELAKHKEELAKIEALKEETDRNCQEKIDMANAEAERIVEEAKAEAERMLEEARQDTEESPKGFRKMMSILSK